MVARILLVDADPHEREDLRRSIGGRGFDVCEAETADGALTAARRYAPDAMVVDMNLPRDAAPLLCHTLKHTPRTQGIPIVALTASARLGETEALFRLGVDACVARPLSPDILARKIAEAMSGGRGETVETDALPIPAELKTLFSRLLADAPRLGDMAEIYAGISPRDRRYQRGAAPAPGWIGVLTEDVVERFRLQPPRVYLYLHRMALIRVPEREEYAQPEKVIVRRTASPVAAAVDPFGLPAGAGAYAIVPAKGLECGYLACVLNSRLLDFYFNRVRPAAPGRLGVYLRRVDLEAVPMALAPASVQRELSGIAMSLATLGDDDAGKARRTSLLHRMNEAIFAAYGLNEAAVRRLTELHF